MDNIVSDTDVRLFLLDRSIEDNPVDLDISFSSEEIVAARRNAIRHFNNLSPIGVAVANNYIQDPHVYLLGIAYYLYMSSYLNLTRNNIDYTAGGMEASTSKLRLQTYLNNIKILKQEFLDAAVSYKNYINQESFYGRIG